MPRKGPAHAITPEWQERVQARLSEMGIKQNELARRAKISKAAMSGALKPGAVQSTVMAQIHKVLGWDPPPVGLSKDELEMLTVYRQMQQRDQGALIERARQDVERARQAVERDKARRLHRKE